MVAALWETAKDRICNRPKVSFQGQGSVDDWYPDSTDRSFGQGLVRAAQIMWQRDPRDDNE